MSTTTSSYANVQAPAFLAQDLDLSYLHAVSGGDRDFEKDMLQSLLGEMSEKMGALQIAIQSNDAAGVRLQSHSLKNLAGIIGVPSLTENFRSIEAAADNAPGAYLLQQFLPCLKQWEQARGMLVQHLGTY